QDVAALDRADGAFARRGARLVAVLRDDVREGLSGLEALTCLERAEARVPPRARDRRRCVLRAGELHEHVLDHDLLRLVSLALALASGDRYAARVGGVEPGLAAVVGGLLRWLRLRAAAGDGERGRQDEGCGF